MVLMTFVFLTFGYLTSQHAALTTGKHFLTASERHLPVNGLTDQPSSIVACRLPSEWVLPQIAYACKYVVPWQNDVRSIKQ
jgi:hypothetical protein